MEIIQHLTYVVCFVAFSLHCIGIYLLLTRSTKIGSGQKILLLNLSISEVLACSCSLASLVVQEIYSPSSAQSKVSLTILRATYVMYLFVMVSITVDRFCEVYFNLKYPLFWSNRKMKLLMLAGWVITSTIVVLSVVLVLWLGDEAYEDIRRAYIFYFYPSTDILFVIVASITYGYIAAKLRRNKTYTANIPVDVSAKQTQNTATMLNGSRSVKYHRSDITMTLNQKRGIIKNRQTDLLLPILLIVTFIIFVVVPDAVLFFMNVQTNRENYTVWQYTTFIFFCSFISDALIYVTLSTTFGRKLVKSLLA